MNIEPLEARIAPAAIVTYTDIDGDIVKITASTGPLDLGDLTIVGGQLRSLTISDPGFAGATITFTVTKAPLGDGLAHVGRIDATGIDLGNVTVRGDLGSIDAGDATLTTPAVKLLSARSIGAFGLATLGGDLHSELRGPLGVLKVTGDVVGAFVSVSGGGIGTINIGGSLVGGAADHTGAIIASGNIGPVKIGGDVVGGSGSFSGVVQSESGKMGAVTIGGSIRGGSAVASGLIYSLGNMGAVTIGDDILGGSSLQSGAIIANGNLPSVTLGGSLLALPGTTGGASSAMIFCGGNLGLVKVAHDVRGGAGNDSGFIHANGVLANVRIGGTVMGGGGQQSGAIHAYTRLGAVQIAGDLRGGGDLFSGAVFTTVGDIGSVTIGGTVQVGRTINVPDHSAAIVSGARLGPVRIGGDFFVGEIAGGAASDIASITIGGWTFYGSIESQRDLGPVKIGSDVRGGAITVAGDLASLTIGRSFVGETLLVGRVIGTPLPRGLITVGGTLGALTIGGDIRGGDSSESAYIEADRITSVLIGGSIVSGIDQDTQSDITHNASIRAGHDIGAITVRGSILGNESPNGISRPTISAFGQRPENVGLTSDLAIRSLAVGGRVFLAEVLAGFGPDEAASAGSNGNASIGTVTVRGDWVASSVSAGIRDAAGDGFGNGDDYVINDTSDAIIARIASITIGGAVIGKFGPGDQFGFTAQQIGIFKAGLYTAPLTPATDPLIQLALLTDDVTIREV